jgi:phage tail-like protein
LATSAASRPYGAYNFLVKISGYNSSAAFTECVIPAAEIDVMEYREGNDKLNTVHKLPGMARYGRLVLRRGMTTNMDLWNWFSSFAQGVGTAQSLSVVLLDSAKSQVMQWNFTNAWPCKYEPPVLHGEKSALAIETLEVVFDTMVLATSPSATQTP